MKKFLFTLAALMMAGSAFAAEYCYFDPFEVQTADLGNEDGIALPLKAHFDAYCNALQVTFTMPEGLTIVDFEKGENFLVLARGPYGTFHYVAHL